MSLNKGKVYQYGNTIRFECRFYDFDGKSTEPDLIKIIIYDYKYKVLSTEILGLNNRKELGLYFFDYTTEKKEQSLYYEWYGEINGTPSLKRGQFNTKFI